MTVYWHEESCNIFHFAVYIHKELAPFLLAISTYNSPFSCSTYQSFILLD